MPTNPTPTDSLDELEKKYPGFSKIPADGQFRVLINAVLLEELTREEAIGYLLAREQRLLHCLGCGDR